MKKILLLMLSLSMALAFEITALAETKVVMEGMYRVRYNYLYNRLLENNNDRQDMSSFFNQKFELAPSFIVSDNLALHMKIVGANDNIWGHAANAEIYDPPDNAANGIEDFEIEHLYMEIGTPFGTFSVGRMSGGETGLSNLGYIGGMFATETELNKSNPFDNEGPSQQIGWEQSFGDFTIGVSYTKTAEQDDQNAGVQSPTVLGPGYTSVGYTTPGYDDDLDEFSITGTYQWKTGAANVEFAYSRDRYGNQDWNNTSSFDDLPLGDVDQFSINPAAMVHFGPVGLHFEAMYMWGQYRPDRQLVPDNNLYPEVNYHGWGAYVDAVYTYGPGQVGVMFSTVEGPDPDEVAYGTAGADTNVRGRLGIGGDFEPFLVAYGAGAHLNGFTSDVTPYTGANSIDDDAGNHTMIGVWADHNITDDLLAHAALGYFYVNTVPDIGDWKHDYGVEMDLGLHVTIMDGLTFSTIFGYFWPGQYNKGGVDANDLGNSYAWVNELKLSF